MEINNNWFSRCVVFLFFRPRSKPISLVQRCQAHCGQIVGGSRWDHRARIAVKQGGCGSTLVDILGRKIPRKSVGMLLQATVCLRRLEKPPVHGGNGG